MRNNRNKRFVSDSAETSFGSSFGCFESKLVLKDTLVGGEGPPTGRLLAAALVLVGVLGVALNALVIAGVRQAQQCRNNTARKTKTTVFRQSILLKELKSYQPYGFCASEMGPSLPQSKLSLRPGAVERTVLLQYLIKTQRRHR
jgi:hypothetical protein